MFVKGSIEDSLARRWLRPTDSMRVCSPPSRRLATLAPRYAGLTALTTAPRTLGLALVGRSPIISLLMGPGRRGLAEVDRRRRP